MYSSEIIQLRFNLNYSEANRSSKAKLIKLLGENWMVVGALLFSSIVLITIALDDLSTISELKESISSYQVSLETADSNLITSGFPQSFLDESKSLNSRLGNLMRRKKEMLWTLKEVSRKIPQFAWLSELSLKGSSLFLKGRALDSLTVASLAKTLRESPLILKVEIKGVKQVEIDGVYLQDFDLTATVK